MVVLGTGVGGLLQPFGEPDQGVDQRVSEVVMEEEEEVEEEEEEKVEEEEERRKRKWRWKERRWRSKRRRRRRRTRGRRRRRWRKWVRKEELINTQEELKCSQVTSQMNNTPAPIRACTLWVQVIRESRSRLLRRLRSDLTS